MNCINCGTSLHAPGRARCPACELDAGLVLAALDEFNGRNHYIAEDAPGGRNERAKRSRRQVDPAFLAWLMLHTNLRAN